MRIGIDIGSTRVDGVLLDTDDKLLAAAKHLTGEHAVESISIVVEELLAHIDPQQVKGIFISTTHLLNALIQQRNLAKTALIRIGTAGSDVDPRWRWPEALREYIRTVLFLESGNSYNQASLNDLTYDLSDLYSFMEKEEIEAVCIVGAFSPLYEQEEVRVKNQISAQFPGTPITMSHQIGSIGLMERENAALLNAFMSKETGRVLHHLADALSGLAIDCPYWLVQNDGSLLTMKEAIEFPILSFASGISNSLKGVASLTSLSDFIAVDVGGSTIEFGKMQGGQMNEVSSSAELLGMDINLELPEFWSLPFGGGNVVSVKDGNAVIHQTIASDIATDGLAWGGHSWTVSDCFLRLYKDALYDPRLKHERLDFVSTEDCRIVVSYVMNKIKGVLEQLQNQEEELPIVLVGGGSPLLHASLFGKYQKVIHPPAYTICNAIGACRSPLSYFIDKVYWLNDRSKNEVVEEAIDMCRKEVLAKGALPDSVKVQYVKEYPFDYLQGEILRVKAKVTGILG
ncbi:hydantoinase/oxoprolinase N-terminal domain-containing protein [Bacillus sp. 1P06AnD]|uniref:hydantoinase/oxoprolinase N-terminal domain-containing protein n=1 Tax=Bacillus sp. 1P06AnD TaxID=3132208 RepID=UPI0039A03063